MFVFIAYFLLVISHCNACVDCMKHRRNLPWKTEHPDNDLPENQKTDTRKDLWQDIKDRGGVKR